MPSAKALTVAFALLAAVPATADQSDVKYLTDVAARLLKGCQVKADDGTILYTPDGKGNYKALWTRDFTYMVENAPELIPPDHVERGIRYLLKGQRADGAVPDRVNPDGKPVYVAGPDNAPLGQPNLDNAPFLVILVDVHLQRLPRGERANLLREWAPALDKAMDWVPLAKSGLVYNDPARPHSPYGFTDTVAKTGELFMESLLYWTACHRLEELHRALGSAQRADVYAARAKQIAGGVDVLWDDQAGAFLAATRDCRQIDVWANAYALWIDFPVAAEKSTRIRQFLVDHYDRYVWRGQVRHLLAGQYWQRMLADVPRERYQNGAYWAAASGWVISALEPARPELARRMAAELVADFRKNGVCECVNEDYRQLESYVVSATNPLPAINRLHEANKP